MVLVPGRPDLSCWFIPVVSPVNKCVLMPHVITAEVTHIKFQGKVHITGNQITQRPHVGDIPPR